MESLNRRVLRMVAMFALLIAVGGCTTRIGDMTMISTKNVDVSGVKQGDRQTGEDCANSVLFIPLGVPDVKNAMDRALEKGKGDILIDGVVSFKGWTVLVFSQTCVVVEGTVSQTAAYQR